MKYGVIDIGSNSVRLMISNGVETLDKLIETTQVAQGLAVSGELHIDAINRTTKAIINFYEYARSINCDNIYCFATEAIRSASNKDIFINILKDYGVHIDIVSSQMEAYLGFAGAYVGGKCCVVDIGGASTEIIVGTHKRLEYSKSLPVGLVRIKDLCGENTQAIQDYVNSTISQYGIVPQFDTLIGIGGTASSFVTIINQMPIFDSKIVHKQIISKQDIVSYTNKIASTPLAERNQIVGLGKKREDIIVGGGYLLAGIMDYLNCDKIMISESDNLEGYLQYKLGKLDIQ